jgi:hypothetical protein
MRPRAEEHRNLRSKIKQRNGSRNETIHGSSLDRSAPANEAPNLDCSLDRSVPNVDRVERRI